MRSQAKRGIAVFAGALAMVGAVACTAQVADKAQPADTPTKTAQAATHLHRPVAVVIEAAQSAHLDAAQLKRIDVIQTELSTDRASRHQLHEKLRASFAAVVRSGTADSKAFDRSVSEAMRVLEQRVDQNVAAAEEIHGILTPAQRAAVAANLRDRINQHFAKQHRAGRAKRFARVASYLVLSTLQVDKLKAVQKQLLGEAKHLRPSRAELLALADAFQGEDFDTALEAFRADKMKILRARVARAGERTDTVLSIFTPGQRELLADLVLDGPAKVLGYKPGAPGYNGSTAQGATR